MSAPLLYYIQHKGFVGNCLSWWADGGHGYTCNLDEAWMVTRAKAREICRQRPQEDIPWPIDEVDRVAVRHVTQGALALEFGKTKAAS